MYCRNCGAVIDGKSPFCPNCGQNPYEASNYCPECGHFCIPGDTSCIQCHAPLTRKPGAMPNAAPMGMNASGFVVADQPQASQQASDLKFLTADKKYCRNCGLVISANAQRCHFCNASTGHNYCQRCGTGTLASDSVCSVCATPLSVAKNVGYIAAPPPVLSSSNSNANATNNNNGGVINAWTNDSGNKFTTGLSNDFNTKDQASFETTLLLCILGIFGLAGIHRLYTKHYVSGILMLLTGGCGMVWTVIDIIIICTDGFKDGNGRPLKR